MPSDVESPQEAGVPGTSGPTRTYSGPDGMEVDWDAARCLHVAACIRISPQAFDARRRPWVDLDAAPADQASAAVRACPTGALRLRGDDAPPPSPVVEVRPNGPLHVSGDVEVLDGRGDAGGAVLDRAPHVALCRCGATGNAPWCDGSHTAVGFRSGAPNPREAEIDAAPSGGRVTITVTDGPYAVSGAPVVGRGQAVISAGGDCRLCRCGRSDDKPFCDGSHRRP